MLIIEQQLDSGRTETVRATDAAKADEGIYGREFVFFVSRN